MYECITFLTSIHACILAHHVIYLSRATRLQCLARSDTSFGLFHLLSIYYLYITNYMNTSCLFKFVYLLFNHDIRLPHVRKYAIVEYQPSLYYHRCSYCFQNEPFSTRQYVLVESHFKRFPILWFAVLCHVLYPAGVLTSLLVSNAMMEINLNSLLSFNTAWLKLSTYLFNEINIKQCQYHISILAIKFHHSYGYLRRIITILLNKIEAAGNYLTAVTRHMTS